MTVLLEHEAIVGGVEHAIDAKEVRRRRQALRWSQEDLAERAGLTGRTVSNAEHGKVGEAAASRIMTALDQGEAELLAASQPEMVSVEQIITTADGPVRVVVTGARDSVSRMDFTHLIAGALRKDNNN